MGLLKNNKEIILPVAASLATAIIMAAANICAVRMSNNTQLQGIENMNKNQIQIAEQANKTQIEVSEKNMTAQLRGVQLTNDTTLRALELNHDKTLSAIKLENRIKEEMSLNEERRKELAERISSARLLVADINIRNAALGSLCDSVEESLRSEKSTLAILAMTQITALQKSFNFDISEDFYINKIKLLPNDVAEKVVTYYRLLQIVKKIDSEFNYKEVTNKISDYYKIFMDYNRIDDKAAAIAIMDLHKAFGEKIPVDFALITSLVAANGYELQGSLYDLIQQPDLARDVRMKAEKYTALNKKLTERAALTDKQLNLAISRMANLFSDFERDLYSPQIESPRKIQ